MAAKLIGEITGDEVISINQYLREGKRKAFGSKGPLVFVTPTYAWRMPKAVEQWIRDTGFHGSREAYFILTCAGSCGNASAYAKKLCATKGCIFAGLPGDNAGKLCSNVSCARTGRMQSHNRKSKTQYYFPWGPDTGQKKIS